MMTNVLYMLLAFAVITGLVLILRTLLNINPGEAAFLSAAVIVLAILSSISMNCISGRSL